MRMLNEELEPLLDAWLEKCQKLCDQKDQKTNMGFDWLPEGAHKTTLTVEVLQKNLRIVADRSFMGKQSSRGVYCFIDRQTGDVLKGSWKAPVKNGKRGNIKDDPAGYMTQYGCMYLR